MSTIILLLKHGADPYIFDGEGFQCIHLAAQLGHTAVAAYMLAQNVPVNSPDMQGMTPLMWAVYKTSTYAYLFWKKEFFISFKLFMFDRIDPTRKSSEVLNLSPPGIIEQNIDGMVLYNFIRNPP